MAEIWERDEIESPCVRVCVIHPTAKICAGCYRTGVEIAQWSRLTPGQRREIMDELPSRAPQLSKRRGGRNARLKR